jgi:response regulator RpfG family c-di-GMP phosphodiesterase
MSSTNFKITFINGTGLHCIGICDILRYWGYEVWRLDSTREFLSLKEADDTNLIVFHFESFSDWEFKEFRRLQRKFPNIPKIVTAPVISSRNISHIDQAGADGYIIYPMTTEQLWRLLGRYELHPKTELVN